MSAARYERSVDLTFGAGVEWRVHRLLALTLDWRVFLPAPWKLWDDLGVFARPILNESLKGGQLWLGISRVW